MRARSLACWLRVVLAALIIAMGCGAGLPGIARALAAARAHVCTCASGGTHASCPVCNRSLGSGRSRVTEVDGVPCGERPSAIDRACDLAVVREPGDLLVTRFVRLGARRDVLASPHTALSEPPTPPPRSAWA